MASIICQHCCVETHPNCRIVSLRYWRLLKMSVKAVQRSVRKTIPAVQVSQLQIHTALRLSSPISSRDYCARYLLGTPDILSTDAPAATLVLEGRLHKSLVPTSALVSQRASGATATCSWDHEEVHPQATIAHDNVSTRRKKTELHT